MTTVSANYYDGRSSQRHAITLSNDNGWLRIRGEEISRDETFNTAHITEKLGSAPRVIRFNDGAHCEISDHEAFESMLKAAGCQPVSIISRLENHWRFALLSLVLILVSIAASYLWLLPWAAKIAAERIPYKAAYFIDEQAMLFFDKNMMAVSKLPETRQRSLQQKYNQLRQGRDLPDYPLQFRSSSSIGANAFALPGGTVVITDELIKLAKNDEEILAVLAHELGHVSERHALRNLLQSSVVALVLTWYVGDVSSLLATAPTLLLQANYTRNFERNADAFAVRMLKDQGMNPSRLSSILDRLEASHRPRNRKPGKVEEWMELLSTHPETEERKQNIKELK